MFTPSAVVVPPSPAGPKPILLILSNSCCSISAYLGSGLLVSIDLKVAFLASCAAFSNVPPIPTPTTIGGQGLGPAFLTVSSTKSITPSAPYDGVSILIADIFSLPKPLPPAVITIRSPGTISVWIIAGVLSFVLILSKTGSFTTDFLR